MRSLSEERRLEEMGLFSLAKPWLGGATAAISK